MALDVLVIVIITSFVQSIFGVGVLLFGTPLLLLQGYDFIHAVAVLLPISLAINAVQIAKDFKNVDFAFYKNILLYTIPFVVVFLLIVTQFTLRINIVIGLFLLFVAAKNYSKKIDAVIKLLVRYEVAYFVLMGVVHGLTNLGGSLLTAIVHSKNYEKNVSRVTIAASYATFAMFQILTLTFSGYDTKISLPNVTAYLIAGLTVFVITEQIVYIAINNDRYSKSFATFLLLSGILLCAKHF